MASTILCTCGNRIGTNLFAGSKVFRLILDDEWDDLGNSPTQDDFSNLFVHSREVFHCEKCSRLIVFWKHDGDPTYYTQESANAA